jgi:hypothetical protein
MYSHLFLEGKHIHITDVLRNLILFKRLPFAVTTHKGCCLFLMPYTLQNCITWDNYRWQLDYSTHLQGHKQFHPEDGGNIFLQNVGNHLPNYNTDSITDNTTTWIFTAMKTSSYFMRGCLLLSISYTNSIQDKITVTWDVMLCGLVDKFQLSEANCCFHLQDRTVATLNTVAAGSSESLIPIMKVHGITSHKTVILIFTNLRTSHLMLNIV